ncbi:MAG: VPLPA-CTERM sorting domain-containing protein [Gammaproteobacteria bacterium]|nr:VPLPA-CTERM sorting domain-containing protein [Gammaproteobacteria bacterium]
MKTRLLLAAGLLSAVGSANAASASYYLDQSNVEGTWADGVNYLLVTISDSLSNPGDIEFLVTPLATLSSSAGSNFGIQRFGFNTTGAGNALTAANIIDPAGWTTGSGNLDGFGAFEVREDGTGSNRQNPLFFRITGIAGDTIYDYAVNGAGGAQGTYFFAAHVAGMTVGPGSAYFGGSTLVPVPAAVWLFGSALGFLGLAKRRTAFA